MKLGTVPQDAGADPEKMIDGNSRRIRVVDSHTGGEPTRVVVSGGPDLGKGTLAGRLERLRREHDDFRSAVVCEPRGSDVVVGALLCQPVDPACAAGVIFFNNVGYLGMCGHGTIGLVATLAFMKRITPGEHRIETPVGTVSAVLHANGEVTVNNVASYRLAANVEVDVPRYGKVRGDVAWGGNWFFLVLEDDDVRASLRGHGIELSLKHVEALTDFTWSIRQALLRQGITGAENQEIDHIELFGPSHLPSVDSKNFVLCPGKAYDRSPCGTGTSAKLACLYADGKIREGQMWKQESIVGSVFEGSIVVKDGKIYPSIRGTAFVNAEAELVLNPQDPFCMGIRS
jgi:4-hydroxyproline epimerase